jgi:enediyne biosynthesis protein E4
MKRRVDIVLLLACMGGLLLLTSLLGASFLFGYVPPFIKEPNAAPIPVPTEDDAEPQGPPFFREVGDSGIDLAYCNGEEAGRLTILEVVGGGVALFDYDGDGLLDVFVAGGGGFEGAAQPGDRTIVGKPCKLYRNLGGFKFKDVTKEVGLEDFPWFYTHGAAVADYDRDGWPDLLVTGWGRVALFHNEPVDPIDPKKGRKFVDVTEKAGLTGITWATSAAWADFDGDGYPDVYIDQYVDWSWDRNPSCGRPPDVCPPQNFSGLPHKLFANRGDGTFKEVSAEAGVCQGGPNAGKALAVLAVDVNADGKPDLYVCNDKTGNLLYINRCTPGHFRFDEVGVKSGAAQDARGATTGSMGVDAADYDGCGRPSIWVTNFEHEEQALYHNDCEGEHVLFRHRTTEAGIGALSRKYVAWGTAFLDLDHHGWEDIVFVSGHVYMDPTVRGNTRRQKPVLLRNQGDGRYKNQTAQGGPYFQRDHLARGVGFGDLDNDGRIDMIVSQINEPVAVLQNVANVDGTHWLGVELIGKDHADVVGARVRLEAGGRTQTRFAKGGGSYASSGDRRLVFGLAATDKIDKLTVIWPNLEQQTWEGDVFPVDRYFTLKQGEKEPERPRGAGL